MDYSWLVPTNPAFSGIWWLFSVKFEASPFRGIANPEQLVQGVFTLGTEQ